MRASGQTFEVEASHPSPWGNLEECALTPNQHTLEMVVGEGFEPSKSMTADLQSAPFGRSGTPPLALLLLAKAGRIIPNAGTL